MGNEDEEELDGCCATRDAAVSLRQKLFRRKPVGVMTAETGADTGGGELARTIGLFQLTLFGVGATIGTGIFIVLTAGRAGGRARR